jgi:hypothetical protein
LPERAQHTLHVRPLILGEREMLDVILERHFLHATACTRVARARDIVRDLDQPVVRLEDLVTALVRAVGVHERRLRDVLRIRRITEQRERVVIDVLDVTTVDGLESLISG